MCDLKFLIFTFLIFSCQAFAGPFGLQQGMTPEQIKNITPLQDLGDFVYTARTLPMGSKEFEQYTFLIVPGFGLCKVVATTKRIETNPAGVALKREFNDYAQILKEKYGTVSETMDFLHAKSIWEDPQYWMRSLEQKEREMSYYWFGDTKRPLPDSLSAIELHAVANNATSGYLDLGYAFKNMEKCTKAVENAANQKKRKSLKNL
jgi:hypothetical protein